MDQVTREEFAVLVERQDAADAEIHEIGRDVKQLRSDTHEIIEMFRALSGGFKLVLLLGKIAAAITAVASAFHAYRNGWFK